MKTELSPTPNVELLPRADLPVIWDGFREQAEKLRTTAETLVVSSVEEKDKMELARTTRLTLKQIRVAVEKKRVELGEGHLTEIQKINSAAKKLKELIEPLEARLLAQETYAERVEADRIIELSKRRNDEVRAIWPGCPGDFGKMPDDEYNELITRLRRERDEMEEEKRRRAEAEAVAAREREAAEKARREAEAILENERAERQRQEERIRREYEERSAREAAEQRKREQEAFEKAEAQRKLEQAQAQREREEEQRRLRAEFEAAEAQRRAERQAEEARRLELEAELAREREAKVAEEIRRMQLAMAPDAEKLWHFVGVLKGIEVPGMSTTAGADFADLLKKELLKVAKVAEDMCRRWGLTTK